MQFHISKNSRKGGNSARPQSYASVPCHLGQVRCAKSRLPAITRADEVPPSGNRVVLAGPGVL